MKEIELLGHSLKLLSEKAIYLASLDSLLVSDVHLGKSETFQKRGIPISNQVNQTTLNRLSLLCSTFNPQRLIILGDLFHSKAGFVDEVLADWLNFVETTEATVQLLLGNHDRFLARSLSQLAIECIPDTLQFDNLLLSHEPQSQPNTLNICGHVHPCVRIKSRLDHLRLPCFYWDATQNQLMLPSFGEFTGGYDLPLKPKSVAYVVVEDAIVEFAG